MNLIYHRDGCREFVSRYSSCPIGPGDWYQGIGLGCGGKMIAAVLYTDMTDCNIQMHVAANANRWAVPLFLKAAFRYPFMQLALPRVTGLVESDNAKALKLNEHLGFTREGVMREGALHGDMVILGMLRRECRWIDYGQTQVERSRAA